MFSVDLPFFVSIRLTILSQCSTAVFTYFVSPARFPSTAILLCNTPSNRIIHFVCPTDAQT